VSRLFIGQREINFFSDITKEVIKDVVGQKIYYYPISETKTKSHGVYNESMQKVFDNPIAIDALVDAQYQTDTKISAFGVDQQYKLEVFVQYRDLVEKGINVSIGDFFSFSDIFYEITEETVMRNTYGLPEHRNGVKLVGTKAREGLFAAPIQGPTDITYTDADAVQKKFEQQRGRAENSEGPTGDVRELVKAGVLEPSLTGPKQVSEKGAISDDSHYGSAFYDDE
jgi:hypothetical protein